MSRKLIIALLVLVIALTMVLPAMAHGPCSSDGSGYGQDHIAAHGPHGNPEHANVNGAGHNPGSHHGYSLCHPGNNP